MKDGPELRIVDTAAAIAEEAAKLLLDAALEAVATHGRFRIALAGGGTPSATYTLLSKPPYRDQMPWDRTWIFFGDERAVGPDHPDSNYRMANEALLSHVPIPP